MGGLRFFSGHNTRHPLTSTRHAIRLVGDTPLESIVLNISHTLGLAASLDGLKAPFNVEVANINDGYHTKNTLKLTRLVPDTPWTSTRHPKNDHNFNERGHFSHFMRRKYLFFLIIIRQGDKHG